MRTSEAGKSYTQEQAMDIAVNGTPTTMDIVGQGMPIFGHADGMTPDQRVRFIRRPEALERFGEEIASRADEVSAALWRGQAMPFGVIELLDANDVASGLFLLYGCGCGAHLGMLDLLGDSPNESLKCIERQKLAWIEEERAAGRDPFEEADHRAAERGAAETANPDFGALDMDKIMRELLGLTHEHGPDCGHEEAPTEATDGIDMGS